MYLTKGIVRVYKNWMVAYLDNQIIEYWRSLIPQYYGVNPPRTPAHISIVRPFENPDRWCWNKFNNWPVDVIYYAGVRTDRNQLYWWLDCDSDDIVDIRRQLGLPDYLGLFECQHITIGNTK
jgi:hypothetical protein